MRNPHPDTTSSSSSGSNSHETSPVLSPAAANSPTRPSVFVLPKVDSRSPDGSPKKYDGFPDAQNSPLLSGLDPESDSDVSRLELAGRASDFSRKSSIDIVDLPLSFCGRVRANVVAQYERFAMSKVGLVVRAFLESLPQSLTLPAAAGFSLSGLVTPIIEDTGSINQLEQYYLYATLGSIILSAFLMGYDSFRRLKNENYDSFFIFRMRALLMGASLGSICMRDFLYYVVKSEKIWLNLFLTSVATILPAYLRYSYFSHDIIPAPLNGNMSALRNIEERKGIFNNRVFNILSASCTSGASGLLLYRSIMSGIVDSDYHPITKIKAVSILVPAALGCFAALLKENAPLTTRRWKQFEILAGDGAMIYIGMIGFFCLNKTELPSFWWGPVAYVALAFSLFCSGIQASRVVANNSLKEGAFRADHSAIGANDDTSMVRSSLALRT